MMRSPISHPAIEPPASGPGFGATPIRWVFWDLGDTLLNEDPLRYHIYELLLRALQRSGRDVSFADLLARRKDLIAGGDTRAHYTIAESDLVPSEYAAWRQAVGQYAAEEWPTVATLVSGAAEVLESLVGRYRMAVIADQPPEVEAALGRLGIGRHFALVAVDSAVGYHKPDQRLFTWALDAARCEPEAAVMIGNRLDLDVAPARRVGMKAILCSVPPAEKGWAPVMPEGVLYRDALVETPNWPNAPHADRPDETPDAVVGALSLVRPVLRAWASP